MKFPTHDIPQGEINICVLPQGNVLIGELYQDGPQYKLANASVIRIWGTTNGLGELAKNGPTEKTTLDKCNGDVFFHVPALIWRLVVDQNKWKTKLTD